MFYFLYQGRERFFFLFLTKKGGWKNVCKNGVPRMGMGRHLHPPRLPPSAASTRPDKMEKNQKDRASFFFTNSKSFVKMARLARMRIMACRATLRCVG